MAIRRFLVRLSALLLAAQMPAQAGSSYHWVGAAGGGDGMYWSDPLNWDSGEVPDDPLATVVIDPTLPAEVIASSTRALNHLVVGTGSRLEARSSLQFHLSGLPASIQNDGEVVIAGGSDSPIEIHAGLSLLGSGETIVGGPNVTFQSTVDVSNDTLHVGPGHRLTLTEGRVRLGTGVLNTEPLRPVSLVNEGFLSIEAAVGGIHGIVPGAEGFVNRGTIRYFGRSSQLLLAPGNYDNHGGLLRAEGFFIEGVGLTDPTLILREGVHFQGGVLSVWRTEGAPSGGGRASIHSGTSLSDVRLESNVPDVSGGTIGTFTFWRGSVLRRVEMDGLNNAFRLRTFPVDGVPQVVDSVRIPETTNLRFSSGDPFLHGIVLAGDNHNDGLIESPPVEGDVHVGPPTFELLEGETRLDGTGSLRMLRHGTRPIIVGAGRELTTLVNGPGHTLHGTGVISDLTLVNYGHIDIERTEAGLMPNFALLNVEITNYGTIYARPDSWLNASAFSAHSISGPGQILADGDLATISIGRTIEIDVYEVRLINGGSLSVSGTASGGPPPFRHIARLIGDPTSWAFIGGQSALLRVGDESDSEFAGRLRGTGRIVKLGGGTWSLTNLTGNSDFSGFLQVAEGRLAYAGAESLVSGAARLELAGGTLQALGSHVLTNSLELFEGSSAFDSGPFEVELIGLLHGSGSLIKQGSGTLRILGPEAFDGELRVAEGTLRIDSNLPQAGATLLAGGRLKGHGHVGALVAEGGVVAPGDPLGRFTVLGNYQQGMAATLEIELNGRQAGLDHDQLVVTGQAALDGTLHVVLGSNLVPKSGDSFHILDAGSVTGSFSGLLLPPLPEGLFWQTARLYSHGLLEVISGTLHTVFELVPGTATVNEAIAPAVIVRVEIGDGTLIGDGIPVTLSLAEGPAAGLSGNHAITSSGRASFPNLVIDTLGSFRLRAEAPGVVDPAISGLIEIRPGAPATLNFIGLPTGGLAGLALTPAVSVQVVDAHGHSVIDGIPVSLTIASGPPGAGITGGAATTLDGLATFPAVVLDRAGSYALRASAGQAQATSSTVTVAPNEPAHISFIVEPSDAIALEPIVPTVVVDVVNTAIRPVPNGTEVTLQVAFGPADAQINGHVATTSSGIAGFPDLSLSPHGLYMLRAVSGQAEIDSEPFEVFEQVLFANGFELEE